MIGLTVNQASPFKQICWNLQAFEEMIYLFISTTVEFWNILEQNMEAIENNFSQQRWKEALMEFLHINFHYIHSLTGFRFELKVPQWW